MPHRGVKPRLAAKKGQLFTLLQKFRQNVGGFKKISTLMNSSPSVKELNSEEKS